MTPRIFLSKIVLSMAALLLAASPGSAQPTRPYNSLAVLDLELDGPAPAEMEEIVDYLSMRIGETRTVRRVVEREEREELLSRKPQEQRSRDYTQDQLSRAARLPVQVAVLGRFSWNGQQYRLQLRLLEVKSGELLFEKGGTFSSKGELYAACDRLAAGIAGAAVSSPPPRKAAGQPRSPLELSLGFGLGQEGVSASSGIGGGSYLYLETLLLLNRFIGLDARYAFRLFPTAWGSHLLSTHFRLHLPPRKEVFMAGELGYLLSVDAQGQPAHFIGARLVPIAGGEEEFFVELLPVALYLDVDTWEAVFTLELLTMRFFIGKR
jgi:hypothetical protein